MSIKSLFSEWNTIAFEGTNCKELALRSKLRSESKNPFSRWKNINCSDPGIYARNEQLTKVIQEWLFWNMSFSASVIDGRLQKWTTIKTMRKRSTGPIPASWLIRGLQTWFDDCCHWRWGLCEYLLIFYFFFLPPQCPQCG